MDALCAISMEINELNQFYYLGEVNLIEVNLRPADACVGERAEIKVSCDA